MNNIRWQIKLFGELSTLEFHDMIQLREKVFIVEQKCPYLDVDGQDLVAYHVLGIDDDTIIATARIFSPNDNDEVIIGRICNELSARGKGVGKELVSKCLEFCNASWENRTVKISAQTYLVKFYKSFGFKTTGEEYLEDGIPHIAMIKK